MNGVRRGPLGRLLVVAVVAAGAVPDKAARGENWPQWRGPRGDGSSIHDGPPVGWSKTRHVAWRTPLPGRGGATPCVWDDRVFVTSNEGDDLVLLAIDAESGRVVWKRRVGGGNADARAGEGNSASPSPSTDGERVWAFFGTGTLACYTRDGDEVWKTDLGERFGAFELQFGMTSTPVLDGDSLYLQLIHGPMRHDETRTGKVVRLAKETGRTIWEVDRPSTARFESKHVYASPFLYRDGTREFLVAHGADCITGHALDDGRELWRFGGLNGPSPTNPRPYDETLRFVASPGVVPGTILVPTAKEGPIVALNVGDDLAGDCTAKKSVVRWVNPKTPDVSTPLVADGLVYLLHKDGQLQCVELATGKDVYVRRTHTGQHRSSPLLAGGRLYFGSNDGWVTVVRAGRDFEIVDSIDFGEGIAASPLIADGVLYLRSSAAVYAIKAE